MYSNNVKEYVLGVASVRQTDGQTDIHSTHKHNNIHTIYSILTKHTYTVYLHNIHAYYTYIVYKKLNETVTCYVQTCHF